ncbi:MAG: PilZ domain-containing protein [Acidobacteria bacterium]|nr:PilZ domain-containing protein [Acidobacteriota bacterium]
MSQEKRSYKRYPVSGKILFQTESMEAPGELIDIGKWGAQIRSKLKPMEGEELTVQFAVQDYPEGFEVKGMVVRVQPNSWAMMFLQETVKLVTLLQFLDKRTQEEIQERGEKEPEKNNLQQKAERDLYRAPWEEAEARARRLEENLTQTKLALQDQRERADSLLRLLETERDQSQAQLSEAEARASSLEQKLATLHQTLMQEKKAAEALAHQLKAEQGKRRTQLSGFESHLQNLEEQLSLAQKQFQDQREMVIRMLQQRAANKEEHL